MAATTQEEKENPKAGWRKRSRPTLARRATRSKVHRREMAQLDAILIRMRQRRTEIERLGQETRALLHQLDVR